MFLIQYSDESFVDGEKIEWLKVGSTPRFRLYGSSMEYVIDEDWIETFLNNLQAINNNISNIEAANAASKEGVINEIG